MPGRGVADSRGPAFSSEAQGMVTETQAYSGPVRRGTDPARAQSQVTVLPEYFRVAGPGLRPNLMMILSPNLKAGAPESLTVTQCRHLRHWPAGAPARRALTGIIESVAPQSRCQPPGARRSAFPGLAGSEARP